ncbi:unnamed protein product [Oikopleura dioica]|uniref:Uncharacterized protein n=1 Tax=Oikopleura dioica TaxID=34765 RepID=E4WVG4_OIKDI|nr:unnamed protein product [Oikopleura dioica]
MKRRMNKEKEEAAMQPGTSGDEVALVVVEEDSPTTTKVKEVISELSRAKTPLELMVDRISTLEQKGKISCIYSCTVCPSEFVERMEELEERTQNFSPAFPISVTDARQIQISLTESIKLSLGFEAYLSYKLVRYNISAKWNDLSYVQASAKKIGSESPLYKEFRGTYNSLHHVAEELDEPIQQAVSRRDGSIVTAKRAFNNIFYELLGVMKTKSPKSLYKLVALVKDIRDDLMLLFGADMSGTLRLTEWLEMAGNATPESLSKHKALSTLRRFYPYENEIDGGFYNYWGLRLIDMNLKSDVGLWEGSAEEEPTPVKKTVKLSQSYFKAHQ